jgi:predicted metal-dependent hydrolase
MSQMKSRRELGLLATGGAIAAAVVLKAKPAAAIRQPAMERARAALGQALEALHDATSDKGGHKLKAIELIQAAIAEVDAGIHFDNTH